MSRFSTVHRIPPSVVLAGQVGCLVRLVASRLAGCPWWNDCENDRRLASIGRPAAAVGLRRQLPAQVAETGSVRASLRASALIWVSC